MNDQAIIRAYCDIVQRRNATADDILVSPDLRAEFLAKVREQTSSLPEKYILKRLIYLRKKGRLPKSRLLVAGSKG